MENDVVYKGKTKKNFWLLNDKESKLYKNLRQVLRPFHLITTPYVKLSVRLDRSAASYIRGS